MDLALKKISDFTGLNIEVLKKAIKEDKPDSIIFDGLKILKESDIATIKENSKRDGASEAKAVFLPQIVKSAGLDGTFNDIKGVLSAVKKNTLKDAKIEPDKKIEELTAQLTTAQNTINEKEKEILNTKTEVQKIALNYSVAAKLPKILPGNLTREEGVDVLMRGVSTVFENGKHYPVENGKKLQDDKGNFIELESYIDSKIEVKGWNQQVGSQQTNGKGGTNLANDTGGSLNSVSDIKTLTQYAEYCDKQGIKQNSAKGQSVLSSAMQNEGFSDE